MKKLVPAFVLACAAVSAAAQTPKEPPQPPQPQEPAAGERAPLNLKLDNPGSWARVGPESEKQQPDGLPSLGDDARPIPAGPPSGARTSPYPSEPSPGR